MAGPLRDYAALIEDVVAAAVADAQVIVADIIAAIGPRPPGFVRGTPLEQLADYLTWRGDPAAFARRIAATAEQMGSPQQAEVVWWNEADRLERGLAEMGGWTDEPADLGRALGDGARAVVTAHTMRDAPAVAREVHKAVAIREGVAALLTPPLPPITPLDVLALGELGPDDQGMLAALAAAAAAPTAATEGPLQGTAPPLWPIRPPPGQPNPQQDTSLMRPA